MSSSRIRLELPWLFAVAAVGLTMGGLLVGVEPVGGDPDRMYRPIKSELARALRAERLPFWSDRFGLGVPLIAESHVAAFYPPNLVLYRVLDVSTAYRLSMWLHYLALATATYAYARRLDLTPWGSALAGLAFTFCGFQAIHSSHEWAYHALPYMPLALLLTDLYVGSGRAAWLAALALTLGAQLTLGHYQTQTYTLGLVVVTGLWRLATDRRPWPRALGLFLAVGWGGAIAAVPLATSWDYARLVGQLRRSIPDLFAYSYPLGHWIEPALPEFFRGVRGGPEGYYWFTQGTTGYESAFYVGTVALVLAFVGLIDGRRGGSLGSWRLLVPASLALATMPRWWPEGYRAVLELPGLGYFRCPSRYMMITSLGLSLLAGRGLDRSVGRWQFRAGLGMALVFCSSAFAQILVWSQRPDFPVVSGLWGLPHGAASAGAAWIVSFGAIVAWRRGRLGGWAPCLVAALELGTLYYRGTTRWGRPVPLPASSPLLTRLGEEKGVGRIAGALDDLPVRAGLTPAFPYLGFALPAPHRAIKIAQIELARNPADVHARNVLRRFGVTHLVWESSAPPAPGKPIELIADPALSLLALNEGRGINKDRPWRLMRLGQPFPEARVALRVREVATEREMTLALFGSVTEDEAYFQTSDLPADWGSPRARTARLLRWDGRAGAVEHDGPCDLILNRTYDPGWRARVGERPEVAVGRADGGVQAIHLPGSGATNVSVRYQPRVLPASALVSSMTLGLAILAGTSPLIFGRRVLTAPTGRVRRGWRPSAA